MILPERPIRRTTALERQGALVFQAKQCRNCHARGGGGERGPGLDRVAVRLTQDPAPRAGAAQSDAGVLRSSGPGLPGYGAGGRRRFHLPGRSTCRYQSNAMARRLLLTSIVYLPLIFIALVLDRA